ncbi:hypothetical protein PGB90_009623 [Kerria lacca]
MFLFLFTDMMVRKSCLITIFTLCFTLDIALTDENQNSSKNEEQDETKYRLMYSPFLNKVFEHWRENEMRPEQNIMNNRDESNEEFIEESSIDISNILRVMSSLLNKENVKRKRGYHYDVVLRKLDGIE